MAKLPSATKALLTDAPKQRTETPVMCSFCKTGQHQYCPRASRGHGPKEQAKIWPCSCSAPECGGGGVLRCLECKIEIPGEVDPNTWSCFDQSACQVRVEKRLAANPSMRAIREITGGRTMARATAVAAKKAERAPKTPRTGTCLVTGLPTKGGLFLPGMDARYVSDLIKSVVAKEVTVPQARKQMKEDGVSDALQAKFEKNLGIARDKAAAEKAAPAKKAAPAAKKAAAKRPAKKLAAVPEPVEEDDEEEADEDEADDGF